MVDHLRIAAQPLPGGVKGRIIVHFSSKVMFSCQMLETVKIVPMAGSASTGILIDHLVICRYAVRLLFCPSLLPLSFNPLPPSILSPPSFNPLPSLPPPSLLHPLPSFNPLPSLPPSILSPPSLLQSSPLPPSFNPLPSLPPSILSPPSLLQSSPLPPSFNPLPSLLQSSPSLAIYQHLTIRMQLSVTKCDQYKPI